MIPLERYARTRTICHQHLQGRQISDADNARSGRWIFTRACREQDYAHILSNQVEGFVR